MSSLSYLDLPQSGSEEALRIYRPGGNKARQKEEKRSVDLRKLFVVIICFLIVVLALQVVYHIFIYPNLTVKKVNLDVIGERSFDDETVLSIAGITGKEYYFSFNETLSAEKIADYPLFRDVKVKKTFPDTVDISLTVREPLAVSFFQTDRGVVPVQIDEDGVVFKVGQEASGLDLPVISGLKFVECRAGVVIPEELIPFLGKLRKIQTESPELYSLISEIKFVKKSRTNFEVLLFPSQYPVRVRLGEDIDSHLLRYMMMALDIVSQQGMENSLKEIDLRTDEIVYRVREE